MAVAEELEHLTKAQLVEFLQVPLPLLQWWWCCVLVLRASVGAAC